jgi:hypothetical protein
MILVFAGNVFADNAVHDPALTIRPLDATRSLASAAEPESFFRRTALPRYLYESLINHNAVFRKRDRAVRQYDPNQARTGFAPPTRAKDR